MTPFTDIHTHRPGPDAAFSVLNIFLDTGRIESFPAVSMGIHPWYIHGMDVQESLRLLRQYATHRHVKAIGECGLDRLAEADMELQEQVFREQVKLAESLQKPLIIHCVKAFDALIHIKKEMRCGIPFIVHGYNNNAVIAEQLLKNGCLLSFGKALLQEGSNAQQLIRGVADDRFFLETDDAAIPINLIFEKAAALRDCSLDALKEKMMSNFKRVLNYE